MNIDKTEYQPTIEQLTQIHSRFAFEAVQTFNEHGEHRPTLIVATVHPDGSCRHMQMPDFAVLPYFSADSHAQQRQNVALLAAKIRSILLPGPVRENMARLAPAPNVVIQINEAWSASTDDPDRGKLPERLEDAPGRVEVIAIQLHTPRGTHIGYSPIHDNPRRAEVGTLYTERMIGGNNAMPDADRVLH
jgi:hypothetical protein